MSPSHKRIQIAFLAAACTGVLFTAATTLFFFVGSVKPASHMSWGVDFSRAQAEMLGLSWQETYQALLDDLGVRRIRLSIPWNELEPLRGNYDFEPWDWQLDELSKRNGKAIVAIGRKLPRWPECHIPAWTQELPQEEQNKALLTTLAQTVDRYRNTPALWAWQVENEPLLPFGLCPKPNPTLLDQEIAVVRRHDPSHPIIITASGEFSFWQNEAKRADILGSTLYRVAYNPLIGFVRYPFAPAMYHRKAALVERRFPNVRVMFSEVQAEPWVTALPISQNSIEAQYKTMDPQQFKKTIAFVRKTGFDEAYLWGSEWWYWLKLHGYPEIWEEARLLFRS